MSDPFHALPRGWCWVSLGDVARLVTGGTPPGTEDNCYGAGVPFLKPTDLNAGRFVVEARQYLTPHGASFLEVLPARSVLITCIGATIGKAGLTSVACATNQQINAAIPVGVEPEFLFWFVVGSTAQNWILDNASATTLPILNKGRLATMPVALAPHGEQRRIVAKLEDLLARSRRAKEALDAIPPLLEKLRQSVLAAAFRGDLTADWREKNPDVEPAEKLLARIRVERRKKWEETELAKMKAKGKAPGDDRWKEKYVEPEPVDASGLPELPEGWCWAAWRELGFSQNGRPFPSSAYTQAGVRLLRPGNLHVSGRLVWTAENTRHLPESFGAENPEAVVGPQQLLMNLTAQSLKDEFLGRVCVSGAGERCLLNQRIARLTPVVLSTRFCLLQFKSPLVRSYIDELNSGSLIQHMFTSQVEEFALPLPPLAEQEEIVGRIERHLAVLDAVASAAQMSHQLAEMDRAILAKAFRGELVPQDPNDEPADVMLARLKAEAPTAAAPSRPPAPRRKATTP